MKVEFHLAAALLMFLSVCACTTKTAISTPTDSHWTFPYPEVPPGKSPEKRASFVKGGFRHDAIERNPKYKEVFGKIDAEVEVAIENHPLRGQFGFVHTHSEIKRRILYWKYGIDWLPITTMTPEVAVD